MEDQHYPVEDCAIWKMALYWATGRQFWDSSHGLKEPNPDRLEDVSGLGTAKIDALAGAGIRTLADVRLATRDDLEAIESKRLDDGEMVLRIRSEVPQRITLTDAG